jgi:hypothetical protein
MNPAAKFNLTCGGGSTVSAVQELRAVDLNARGRPLDKLLLEAEWRG